MTFYLIRKNVISSKLNHFHVRINHLWWRYTEQINQSMNDTVNKVNGKVLWIFRSDRNLLELLLLAFFFHVNTSTMYGQPTPWETTIFLKSNTIGLYYDHIPSKIFKTTLFELKQLFILLCIFWFVSSPFDNKIVWWIYMVFIRFNRHSYADKIVRVN